MASLDLHVLIDFILQIILFSFITESCLNRGVLSFAERLQLHTIKTHLMLPKASNLQGRFEGTEKLCSYKAQTLDQVLIT